MLCGDFVQPCTPSQTGADVQLALLIMMPMTFAGPVRALLSTIGFSQVHMHHSDLSRSSAPQLQFGKCRVGYKNKGGAQQI